MSESTDTSNPHPTAGQLPPPKPGSIRAVLGEQGWLEHERRRTAQYGFCALGHHRGARPVHCGCCNRYQRIELFCWTCENS